MSYIPKPHEIYKHFKGNLYQILAVAEHTETGEQLVIYQALYGDFKIFARELSMFTSPVDKEKYPDAVQEFRFELQGAEGRQQRAISIQETVNTREWEEAEEIPNAVIKPEVSQDIEPALDPLVMEFLDADTYEQRLNILAGLHYRITDDMITTMAIACDVEIKDGSLEERFTALKSCLITLDKYECNRLR